MQAAIDATNFMYDKNGKTANFEAYEKYMRVN